MRRSAIVRSAALLVVAAGSLLSAEVRDTSAADPKRVEFTRMVAHWAEYGDRDAYLAFLDAAKPEVAQFGFYGAHFWSLAHTPSGKGYPAHFPVQGHAECRAWFADMNRELHRRGIKVVGHMNVKFLVGAPDTPDGPKGFFDFYANGWDERILGPKPVADPLDFVERKADGTPIVAGNYSIGKMPEYWACLLNPNWRSVLKAWTKAGIAQGADGFVANYFYRHDCHCRHCVAGFKAHLRARHKPDELQAKFGIADLEAHVFPEIVAWHKPDESTPLRREMLAFSQIANKRAFDEVFVEYGRSLKPDLIVAQWNHLGDFSQISGDERCLLPTDLWGKDESYLWYSTGASANHTDLEAGWLGEGTLQARYIRGAFDDKPFTLGKYEGTRIRAAIAELAANGGAPMGFYARVKDPEAREVFSRYYGFLAKHDPLFRASRPQAEVVLLFPRSAVHAGNVEAVATFKRLGRELLDRHVLFEIRPDELPSAAGQGSDTRPTIDPKTATALPSLPADLSRFEASSRVRVSQDRTADGKHLVLHFVNYDRTEPPQKKSAGRGASDEKPIPAKGVKADLKLPPGGIGKIAFLTPEAPEPIELKYEAGDGRVRFEVPEFLVHGVVRIELKP